MSTQRSQEWANQQGYELETLLSKGWCRIQNVPTPYLLIDFRVPLNAAQAEAVGMLFQNRFSVYLVEFRGEVREFEDGEEAIRYVLGLK